MQKGDITCIGMMETTDAQQLINKFLENQLSPEEEAILDGWYLSLSDDQSVEITDEQLREKKAVVLNRLNAGYLGEQRSIIRLWPHIAAAILVIIGVSLFYYTAYYSGKDQQSTVYVNDVAPGRIGATLVLNNGKKILLADVGNGELARESGAVISKADNGELTYEIKDQTGTASGRTNTLITAKGETFKLRLPDGTVIWLNSESSLKYPASFTKLDYRNVVLEGEAYFEVSKDKKHPFIVKSRGQLVEVLGTHFNINSYANEPVIKTTLLEGAVAVSTSGGNKRMLKPNQQSVLAGDNIQVNPVEVDDAIDWKNGYFMFNNEPLEGVMRKIARWYNVETSFEDAGLAQKEVYGTITRFTNVSKVLELLEQTGVVTFEIKGNRIVVKRKTK